MVRSVSTGAVILIAPPAVAASLLKRGLFDVQYFISLEAFEAWREGGAGLHDPPTPLGQRVDAALREVGINPTELPVGLTLAIEWLRSRETVPHLKSLAVATSSRRSFFRNWAEVTQVRPSDFLEHLRGLYAEDLLREGARLRDVLLRTGCTSPVALQRCLEMRHHFRLRGNW
jgi:hypothetical protein